jgi:calcineurin-like phosphoesterase family protein/Big-like domain-containing protein
MFQPNYFGRRGTLQSLILLFAILLWVVPSSSQTTGDFTIVVLPDTQFYSQDHPQIFDSQTQWVANNAAAQNIKLVLGEGDIVNVGTDPAQWANAVHSIGILDQAGIPFAMTIGNHDYDERPPVNRQATNFNQYFGPARYAGKPYYGTTNYPSGSNENFYETFTWGGKSYLILVLEFVPRSGAVAWAKTVLSANTDKEVIVATHSYLYSDGTTVDQCDTQDMVGDNNGAMLWAGLVSQYPNISVVVSGHVTSKFTARRSDVGVNGNFVHQIFANWQAWTNGGNGYLRIMKFSPSKNTISVQTYSPFTGLFLTDNPDQFTLKWHNDGAAGTGVAAVTGRVRTAAEGSSCKPIAGSTVNVGGVNTATDANGNYTLTQSPGQLSSNASASGFHTQTQTATLNDYFQNELNFFLSSTFNGCPLSSTDPSVTICTPAPNATLQSPVPVLAGAFDTLAAVTNMFIWVDGVKQLTGSGGSVNTSLPLANGAHRITVQAKDATAKIFQSTVNVTVASAPANPSVTISAPAAGATVSSPVNIVAQSSDPGATVVNMFIWVDGAKQWTGTGGSVNTSLAMAAGTHRITVQAKDSTAKLFQSTVNVTVSSAPTNPSVTISAPAAGATVSSPVNIVAQSSDPGATVVNMFIWVDGVKTWTGTGSSVNTSFSMTTGAHRITVQAKDATAKIFQSTVNVTVSANLTVTISTPAAGATVSSPVTIAAHSSDPGATVTNMFIWLDGVKRWMGAGGSVNTVLSMAAGGHRITVQAKDSLQRYFQSTVYATVH